MGAENGTEEGVDWRLRGRQRLDWDIIWMCSPPAHVQTCGGGMVHVGECGERVRSLWPRPPPPPPHTNRGADDVPTQRLRQDMGVGHGCGTWVRDMGAGHGCGAGAGHGVGQRCGAEVWGMGVGQRCGAWVWGRGVGQGCGAWVWGMGVGRVQGMEWGRGVGQRCGAWVWGRGVGHGCGAGVWGRGVGHGCGAWVWGMGVGHEQPSRLHEQAEEDAEIRKRQGALKERQRLLEEEDRKLVRLRCLEVCCVLWGHGDAESGGACQRRTGYGCHCDQDTSQQIVPLTHFERWHKCQTAKTGTRGNPEAEEALVKQLTAEGRSGLVGLRELQTQKGHGW